MTDYIIYSPFNGQVVSSNCYCYRHSDNCNSACAGTNTFCKDVMACRNCSGCAPCGICCKHTIIRESYGYIRPLDINAGYNYYIYIYMSTNIATHGSVILETDFEICPNFAPLGLRNTVESQGFLPLYKRV